MEGHIELCDRTALEDLFRLLSSVPVGKRRQMQWHIHIEDADRIIELEMPTGVGAVPILAMPNEFHDHWQLFGARVAFDGARGALSFSYISDGA